MSTKAQDLAEVALMSLTDLVELGNLTTTDFLDGSIAWVRSLGEDYVLTRLPLALPADGNIVVPSGIEPAANWVRRRLEAWGRVDADGKLLGGKGIVDVLRAGDGSYLVKLEEGLVPDSVSLGNRPGLLVSPNNPKRGETVSVVASEDPNESNAILVQTFSDGDRTDLSFTIRVSTKRVDP